MRQWLFAVWDRMRSSYWFVPSVMAFSSVVLALVAVQLDERYRDDALRKQGWIYSGGPEGARAVLSTIAGSIITVAGTTFSITIAALSLASAQFGPRLLRNFMRDTGNQVVLGTFTATFLYCLLVLRTVRGLDDNVYVPHLSVTIGVLLAVLSLIVLIYFIHHIAESIQVGHIIAVVSAEMHRALKRLFPEGIADAAPDPELDMEVKCTVSSVGEGYVQQVGADRLLHSARQADVQLRVLHRPGDYVLHGAPLVASSGPLDERQSAAIRGAFTLGRERTLHQDAEYGILQLVEIALRALSPGVNDPFTAIMCIDRITAGMKQLAARAVPSAVRRDNDGTIRVIARPYDYPELVHAGYSQISESAVGNAAVLRRLRTQLETLAAIPADARFTAAVRAQIQALP